MSANTLLSHPYEPRLDKHLDAGCAFCGKPECHTVHGAEWQQQSEKEIQIAKGAV